MSDSDASLVDPVQRLVAECLMRERVEGDAAIEAVCEAHPEHAASVRRRLDLLRMVGLGKATTASRAEVPERLGDFRLLRKLGGGGMGVVYLARQESLQRDVALKLVRPEHLYFDGARERFRREIDAVARLQHPAIVPIYCVGEANGIPYFAMEYVAGRSLAEILSALGSTPEETRSGARLAALLQSTATPTDSDTARTSPLFTGGWTETCLRIVAQIAGALAHAHERGVLHRDIKPSNIMLTASGRVLLLDFGLAATEAASQVTKTGALMGSLPYMSPEQVTGDTKHIDHRTDVYSLGVTLYELLTLTLPFPAANVAQARQEILAGPKTSVRTQSPQVSWDAETVCLKAMDRDPHQRYASATEFLLDLQNVLELRPIQARRASAARQVWRWTQRHPTKTVAAMLSVLLVIGVAIAWMVRERIANRELREKNREISTALDSAESNLRQALGAVDQFLSRVGTHVLAGLPEMEVALPQVLDDARHCYEDLLARRPQDAAVRYATGQAHARLGLVHEQLGNDERAVEHHTRAVALLEALVRDLPAHTDYRSSLSYARTLLAKSLGLCGRRAEALPVLDAALVLQRELVAEASADASLRDILAAMLVTRATFFAETDGNSAGALRALEEALGVQRQVVAEQPSRPEYRDGLASIHANLGTLRKLAKQNDAAKTELLAAVDQQTEAVALRANRPILLHMDQAHLATYQAALAAQLRSMGEAAQAVTWFRKALDQREALVKVYPSHMPYRSAAAKLKLVVARWWADQGRLLEAMEATEAAIAHQVIMGELGGRGTADEAMRNAFALMTRCGDQLLARRTAESWRVLRRAAGLFALSAGEELRDAQASLEEREAVAAPQIERAFALLEAAVERGFRDLADLEEDASLEPLRGRDRFEAILARVAEIEDQEGG